MTDAALTDEMPTATKKGKKTLLFGVIAALLLGSGGFYATYSGLVFAPKTDSAAAPAGTGDTGAPAGEPVVFVALDPLIISLGKYANARHLKFSGSLEVAPAAADEVRNLMPRILDVLNTYLRAISESELQDPASMNRLRAQMLRRVQIVSGSDKVRDLLITEFVLN